MNLTSVFVVLFGVNFSTIKDCGTNPLFTIVSQDFSPESPKAGENVTWTIQYKVPENVVANTVTSVDSGMINGFLPIDPTYSDLCGLIECPVTSGTYTMSNTNVWPDGLSGSKVILQSEWVDENGSELLCSKVTVTGASKLLRG